MRGLFMCKGVRHLNSSSTSSSPHSRKHPLCPLEYIASRNVMLLVVGWCVNNSKLNRIPFCPSIKCYLCRTRSEPLHNDCDVPVMIIFDCFWCLVRWWWWWVKRLARQVLESLCHDNRVYVCRCVPPYWWWWSIALLLSCTVHQWLLPLDALLFC